MKRALFLKFTAAASLYYMSYAVIINFAALFMQSKGFSNTQIGVFFAASSLCCIALQYFSGSFLDSRPTVSPKALVLTSGIITLAAGILLWLAPQRWLIFLCYTVIGSLMLTNSSLYNSFGMEYINAGVPLNYSLARGFGSFSYAAAALIMGTVIKYFSLMSIFPVYFVMQCAMLVFLAILRPAQKIEKISISGPRTETSPKSSRISDPQPETLQESGRISEPESETIQENGRLSDPRTETAQKDSFPAFLRRNPRILFLLVSILLIYISYTSINNFHINIIEEVGGGSRELGISTSLAALLELPAMALFLPLSKRFSYRSLLCFSCTFFFVKLVTLFFAGSITGVYLSQCLQFFSYGLFIPASAYFMNSILPVQDMTKGQSALGIFTFGLSGLISSLLSGVMLDHFGVKRLLGLECVLALVGLAGVFIACRRLAGQNQTEADHAKT